MSRFCSKSAGDNMRRKLYVAVLAALSVSAYAVPEGGRVTAGAADIINSGDTYTIEQNSQRVVLEFDNFDVAAQETVNFVQPNSDAVALNRVMGSDLSTIHGAINANGHVYLINPNGILFGAGAQVNVGGLVATTLDMSDQDFLDQREQLQGAAQGLVENRGQIVAAERVALVAPDIINSGEVSVPGGDAMLLSSRSLLLHSPGSEIPLLVEDPQFTGQIINEGHVSAGRVVMAMEGQGSRDVYDNAIHNNGIVRAVRASGEGGSVHLLADAGDVVHSGEIDVSADRGAGGDVIVRAERYGQTGTIEASGRGAGSGGDVSIRAEQTIAMIDDSRISANGGEDGNGGDVILYAQEDTWFTEGAEITARGGSIAGDGGFAEVSGKEFINVHGAVDVGAVNGEAGTWYIDPTNIDITTGSTNSGTFVGPDPFNWDHSGVIGTATIGVLAIQSALMNGSLIINTASAQPDAGDITVRAYININDLPAGRTLSLIADRDIVFHGDSGVEDASPGGDELNVVLNAGRDIMFNGGTSIDVGTATFSARANGFISVTNITSTSTSGQAIVLESFTNELRNTNLLTNVSALNGGVVLGAATGINLFNYVNSAGLGLRHYGVSPFTYDHSGDLILTSVGLGTDSIFTINATGSITYTGTGGGDLDGATNAELTLDADTTLAINGDLADITGAVDNSTALNFIAGTGFSMADGVAVNAGGGAINVTTTSGDAEVSGLTSTSSAADAIRINSGGALLGTTGDSISLSAVSGGLVVNTVDGVANLDTQVAQVDITAGTGDITFSEVDDVEVVHLSSNDAINVAAGGNFLLPGTASVSANQLSVSALGSIVLPDIGLTLADALTLSADDIFSESGNRSLALAAPNLAIATAASGGDLTFAATANILDVASGGANVLTVNSVSDMLAVANSGPGTVNIFDADALTLISAVPTSGSTIVQSGGGADLALSGGSVIDLSGGNGALSLVSDNDLLIESDIINSVSASAPTLALTAANGVMFANTARVDLGAGNLSVSASMGGVTLGQVLANSVEVNAGSAIMDANGDEQNIIATAATMTAGGDIGTAMDALDGDVDALTVSAENVYYGNAQAMSLAVAAAADLNVALPAGGDLTVLDAAPAISGNSHFDVAAGDLIIADAGLDLGGSLRISADNLRDSDHNVTLAANDAQITLRDGGAAHIWNTSFDTLTATIAAAGALTISDSDALTVDGLMTGGDASINATGSNLMLTTTPRVGGNLNLATIGAGDIVLPSDGLEHSGLLGLEADHIVDGDNSVSISAGELTIRQRLGDIDTTFNTHTDSLDLQFIGNSAVSVIDSGDLTVTGFAAGGDADITAAGNLTLLANIDVPGLLSLHTLNTGQLITSAGGIVTSGSLELDAAGLSDGDAQVAIQANSADIILRNQQQPLTLTTSLQQLNFNHVASTALHVVQTGDLLVNQLSAGGDVSLDTSANLTLTESAPALAGDLQLRVGDGLIIADQGLQVGAALAVDAATVANASGAGATVWRASSADLHIRDSAQNDSVSIQVNQLNLRYDGANAFTVELEDDTAINGLVSTAGITLNSAGDMQLLAIDTINVPLTLHASGTLTLADAGLTFADSLQVAAANLNATSGGAVSVTGTQANIALTGEQGLRLATQLAQLGLTYAAAADLTVVNEGNLEMTSWQIDHATNVGLSLNGTLAVPETGLAAPGRLTIDALDLTDSDRTIDLRAPQLNVRLSNSSGSNVWRIDSDQFDALVGGQANLSVLADHDLTLQDLDGDGNAIDVDNGNFALQLSNGTLHIDDNLSVQDQSADGMRGGVIDVQVAQGNIQIGLNRNAAIVSSNTVDTSASSPAGGENAIRLRLTDSGSSDRRIVLGGGTTDVSVRAVGGDIEINARPTDTASPAQRTITTAIGTTISAYNDISDPLTGTVSWNGAPKTAEPWQQIRHGRTLALVANVEQAPDLGEVLNEIVDVNDNINVKDETPEQGSDVEQQYDMAFGQCDELDQSSSQHCRVDAALKAFLSHLLVGGELPPKSEI